MDHLADGSEILCCSSEVFASSSFKGLDSQFSAKLDNWDISVSDWEILSWNCVLFELLSFVFSILFYYETEILHLSGVCFYYLCFSLTWWAKSLLTWSSSLFLSYYVRVAWNLLLKIRDELDWGLYWKSILWALLKLFWCLFLLRWNVSVDGKTLLNFLLGWCVLWLLVLWGVQEEGWDDLLTLWASWCGFKKLVWCSLPARASSLDSACRDFDIIEGFVFWDSHKHYWFFVLLSEWF